MRTLLFTLLLLVGVGNAQTTNAYYGDVCGLEGQPKCPPKDAPCRNTQAGCPVPAMVDAKPAEYLKDSGNWILGTATDGDYRDTALACELFGKIFHRDTDMRPEGCYVWMEPQVITEPVETYTLAEANAEARMRTAPPAPTVTMPAAEWGGVAIVPGDGKGINGKEFDLNVTPAVQHGINLTWTQGSCNPSCTITKNSVYSAATSAGPFNLIFTSTAPIISYLDPMTSTNQGAQSCYVVTAWTTIESNQSTPAVCNTFPMQSGSPSNMSSSQQ